MPANPWGEVKHDPIQVMMAQRTCTPGHKWDPDEEKRGLYGTVAHPHAKAEDPAILRGEKPGHVVCPLCNVEFDVTDRDVRERYARPTVATA